MKFLFAIVFICGQVIAASNDLSHRPVSFNYKNMKATFVDFETAHYSIKYDLMKQIASVRAHMIFNMVEEGYPIFDCVEAPTAIRLNGKSVSATEVSTPNDESKVRVITSRVGIGQHTLDIDLPLKELVKFSSSGVKSAFWTTDLEDRNYLEAYVPANYEFDQIKITFDVQFIGSKANQKIYANGIITELAANHFQIEFPEYFTASSLYFHTVPENSVDELRFSVKSIDGRDLPAVVYKLKTESTEVTSLKTLKSDVLKVIAELESDYGPFLHNSITVFNAGSGGMEYCGATMTSRYALEHELTHSYFARGMMPANGNSGWIDEAIASWRDEGYKSSKTMSGTSKMSSHPYYTRKTDRDAYDFGESFMRYLNGKTSSKGGLKAFLRYVVDRKSLAPLFVEEFSKEMSEFYGLDLESEFKRYTYSSKKAPSSPMKLNPHHQKLTIAELRNLL